MKLVRFGAAGAEKPGLVDATGAIRDLSGHVKDITGDTLSPASLAKLKADRSEVAARSAEGRAHGVAASIHRRPRNFIAVGLNYADHAS